MRQFYLEYKDYPNLQQLVGEIAWGQNLMILSKVKDSQAREYYLKTTCDMGWTRNVLEMQIESQAYERHILSNKSHNFEKALPAHLAEQADKAMKSIYMLDTLGLTPLMQLSLRAQRLFGLRVEESLKIQPFVADRGTALFIKGSWAKGGRDRSIPIRTAEQRAWLDEAKALVKNKQASLIPIDASYKTYRERFNKACQRTGIYHCHGHCHRYAQERFKELTGYACPTSGGLKRSELSPGQLELDKEARLQISEELGHGRSCVTRIYC